MPVISPATQLAQHSTTVKNIIKRALSLLEVRGEGEDPTASDLADGMEALNQLVDAWNTEKLIAYAFARQAWTIGAGVQDLEIGPGADLDTARPQTIEQGLAFIKSGNQEYELHIPTAQQWAAITDKTQTGRPSELYYEPAFPRATVHFWPKTDASYDFVLYDRTLLSQVTSAIQGISLPPGYARALSTNLAVELAPTYNRTAAAEVVVMAIESKGKIKAANQQPVDIACDSALVSPGWYDIRSGGWL